jgi:hypothetical protein
LAREFSDTTTEGQATSENRKPTREREPEDYRKAADDSMELAKVLDGQGAISDQDFLERMARSDELVDHDGQTCGMCHNMILGAQVAREMIEAGEYEDVVSKWATEARRRWEQSKFFKLCRKKSRPVAIRTRRSRSAGGNLRPQVRSLTPVHLARRRRRQPVGATTPQGIR